MVDFEHSIDISEAAGVRYLHFGSDWVQGAMRIRRPNSLELAYTREMMAALLLRTASDWPRRVLLVGLGAGSLAKFIYHHLPHCKQTVVEIDARMVAVAEHYFRLPNDPQRLRLVIEDAADFVARTRQRYDAIFVDGFTADGRAGALDKLPFYEACRQRLSQEGLLICNLLSRSRGYQACVSRLQQAFEGRVIVFPSVDSGNAIAFAATGQRLTTTAQDMRSRAQELRTASGLDLRATVTRLEQAGGFSHGELQL